TVPAFDCHSVESIAILFEGATMIEVYFGPPSIYGRKVLIVLMEKKLDFGIRLINFADKDQRKPDYLALNPNGKVPTLIDRGHVIYESSAIAEYLDEAYPSPPLMPSDPYQRARIRMIDDFCDLYLYPSLINCIVKKWFTHEPITDDDLNAIFENVTRIDAYLADKTFLSDRFSLADCAFMSAVPALDLFEITPRLTEYYALTRYIDALKARPSYEAAMMVTAERTKKYLL
ncbi:MAG: glutathione S-transferase family protein, partial [Gammaproteobacteria bacterium]